MSSSREAIETYIRAKDENRPYLMPRAFAAEATLEVIVKTGTIAFPPASTGLASICDVLVRKFTQSYENIHTFCLATPPSDMVLNFSCDWLVGMSERDGEKVRVGCGRYDWSFHPHGLVDRIIITIRMMESLDPSHLSIVMDWLGDLPYPWCTRELALTSMPPLDALRSIRNDLIHACT